MKKIILFLLLISASSAAQAQALLSFRVSNPAPQPGETIIAAVEASERYGLAGGQFSIRYDKNKWILSSEPKTDELLANSIFAANISTPGEIKVSFADPDYLMEAGSGALFTFMLTAAQTEGDSILEFAEANLYYPLGQPIALAASSLSLTILAVEASPIPAPKPIMTYEFNFPTLKENDWGEIRGGFTAEAPGIVALTPFPDGWIPSSKDGKGLSITVDAGEIVMLYAKNPVKYASGPVLLRMTLRADGPNASAWLVGLKGNLEGKTMDGSNAQHYVASTAKFQDKERRIAAIYQPDAGEEFTPLIQIAGGEGRDPVTAWIDKIEILQVDAGAFGAEPE
ncbi:MAG: cohesin domain-containing protein [Candidatus Omnitrophota bacterium]